MLAALLMGLLFFSGGGFTAKIFGKDTQAVVREAVSDPARAEVALQILKQGNKDLKPITKQLDAIAKAFAKADEAQSAGLDVLTPFLQQASEQRRIAQSKSLDRLFELRQTLTEEEWNKVFAKIT
jgi:acyl carrier protein phosphodiesterase